MHRLMRPFNSKVKSGSNRMTWRYNIYFSDSQFILSTKPKYLWAFYVGYNRSWSNRFCFVDKLQICLSGCLDMLYEIQSNNKPPPMNGNRLIIHLSTTMDNWCMLNKCFFSNYRYKLCMVHFILSNRTRSMCLFINPFWCL